MPRRYVLRCDSVAEPDVKAGTIVYEFCEDDYGCAETDTRAIGRACLSVTLSQSGGYPFFVVPVDDLAPANGALGTWIDDRLARWAGKRRR